MFWWSGFVFFIVSLIALDLAVFHRKIHEIKFKEALLWSLFWVTLAFGFNVLVYFTRGGEAAVQFFICYVLEKSLSVDNLFVFYLIFAFFRVPKEAQHKVLLWGMVGALILRMGCIFIGAEFLIHFSWVVYVFAAFLIFSAIKMFFQEEIGLDYKKSPLMRAVQSIIPVTHEYHKGRFFIHKRGAWVATPLFLSVIAVQVVDVVYALDSIPAILAITLDRYIAYTSNIFALFGLKAFYFVMIQMLLRFHYMRMGLALILIMVGGKIFLDPFYKISNGVLIVLIASVYLVTFVLSLIFPKKPKIKHF